MGFIFIRNRLVGNKFIYIENKWNIESVHLKTPFSLDSKILSNKSKFEILNIEKKFESIGSINWNFLGNGKLWCYNLNYFEFLLQKGLDCDLGIDLILSYIKNQSVLKDGLESYPISLRNINWIKFLTTHRIKNSKIDSFTYSCYLHLLKNLEYHLLGNHLLENAFSLFIGSILL